MNDEENWVEETASTQYLKVGEYRKKPIIVEAVQLTEENVVEVAAWCEGVPYSRGGVLITTLEGMMMAMPGNWMVKGVEGEFYPVADSIFHKTYDEVEG